MSRCRSGRADSWGIGLERFVGLVGGSRRKAAAVQVVAMVRIVPPLGVLLLLISGAGLAGYVALFFLIGAMMNVVTIGYLGYLVEISPEDCRPAYSAYFNALASPAALTPLLGAAFVSLVSMHAVFVAAIAAAIWQMILLYRIASLKSVADLNQD